MTKANAARIGITKERKLADPPIVVNYGAMGSVLIVLATFAVLGLAFWGFVAAATWWLA